MKPERIRYKRLPGKRRGLTSTDTLWIGPDHLLSVRSYRLTEHYRRFYFRDIQALSMQVVKTPGMAWIDWCVAAAVLFLLFLFFATTSPFWITLTILAAIVYAWIRARRATCTTWIQTAIGTERLPSLRRVRPATKALALIEARVLEAQSDLAVAAAVPDSPQTVASEPLPPPVSPAEQPPPLAGKVPPQPVRIYATAALAAALAGALKLWSVYRPAAAFAWILPISYLAPTLLLGIPLFRGSLGALPPPAKIAMVTLLVCSGLMTVLSGQHLMMSLETPGNEGGRKVIAAIDSVRFLNVSPGVLLVLCGVWGLASLWFVRPGSNEDVR
jgi:hypothetical protein